MPRSQRIFKKRKNVGVPRKVSTSISAEQPPPDAKQLNKPCSSPKREVQVQLPVLPQYDQFTSDKDNDVPFGYSIVNLSSFNELLNKKCSCKICHQPVKVYAKRNGSVENIHIRCDVCSIDQF